MKNLNIIELIANISFDEKRFYELIDPAGSLAEESRKRFREQFESNQQNLITFYNKLKGEKSEVDYLKRSINSYFDQKVSEQLQEQRTEAKEAESTDNKINPIEDLDGSDSWGYNDDVKWK